MLAGYDIESIAIVYIFIKYTPKSDEESYNYQGFLDIRLNEWYSAKDLNQIINN